MKLGESTGQAATFVLLPGSRQLTLADLGGGAGAMPPPPKCQDPWLPYCYVRLDSRRLRHLGPICSLDPPVSTDQRLPSSDDRWRCEAVLSHWAASCVEESELWPVQVFLCLNYCQPLRVRLTLQRLWLYTSDTTSDTSVNSGRPRPTCIPHHLLKHALLLFRSPF